MVEPTLLLVGGGHAHALMLAAWAETPLRGAEVVVLSPARWTPYSGMLPGHVAGHYAWQDFHIDLQALADAAGATLILDRCTGLAPARSEAQRAAGPPVAWDLCSLDIGSTSEPPAVPGAACHLHPVKPLPPFLDAWDRFLAAAARRSGPPRAAVVGGGVGGIELSLAMIYRLRRQDPRAQLTLIERGPVVAGELAASARRRLEAALLTGGIAVRTGAAATAFDEAGVTLAEGRINAEFVAAAVGARPAPWLTETGLALDARGFVAVDAHLRSVSHPSVFAVGDVAHLTTAPRPKAGVFAVRQAPVLDRVLRAVLAGQPLPRYEPQRDYLRLISLGAKRALAVKSGLAVGGMGPLGAAIWRAKDRIDQRFMTGLTARR